MVRYFTGVPCSYGHLSERHVKSFGCVECRRIASRKSANSGAARERRLEYMRSYNRSPAGKAAFKNYEATDKAASRARKRRATPEHKEYMRKYFSDPRWMEYFKEYNASDAAKARKASWRRSEEGRASLHAWLKSGSPSAERYRISRNLRSRLRSALRGRAKRGSAVRDLGCSVEELMAHIESKFHHQMTWENYGKWHIDHIRPLSSFNLSDPEQVKAACHFTNLQPLWAKDNISKGAKSVENWQRGDAAQEAA